ncbi:MAG TPA: beta-ketoacyl-ACP synthase II [Acidimicrobiales bacterium]|jgi:3-oxoacyl-[acyl-carrier-protein] synthase II|nr:beta-ketoacyl-ACP synthase II [Acidimicrobiales bacterium]
MATRRVAITGLGVISAAGSSAEAFWNGLLAPQPEGERRVNGFDPTPHFDNPKEARRADRFTQFALAASDQALAQAGDLATDPTRIGTWVGTGVGGIATLEEQIVIRHERGEKRVSPFLVPMMMANAAAGTISIRKGFEGPCENTVTACAAGTQSIGNAARLIQTGRCDVVVTGGSEASMTPTAIAGFTNMTALSSSGYSRPFDRDRDGFVISEAAGILVLEEWDHAIARGAPILAEILGSASTADAYHLTAPAPGGTGAVRCIELALADAGLGAADIVHVNAHGTSTPLNDATEAEALHKVFGAPGPLVTSTKGVTGHALGAAGAIEAIAVVLTMHHRLIPPTAGTVNLDPDIAPVNLVYGEPRPWTPGPTISNSFGFGGHNACLVIAPVS